MTAALPVDLYADPRQILERAESGDAMPQEAPTAAGCLQCTHARSSLDGWPCAINCMPSSTRGRCARWSRE